MFGDAGVGLPGPVLKTQPALGSSTWGPSVGQRCLAETTRAVSWIPEIKMQMKSCASQAGPLGSCLSVRGCRLTVPWENVSRFLDSQVVRKRRASNGCLWLFTPAALCDHLLQPLLGWLIGRREDSLLLLLSVRYPLKATYICKIIWHVSLANALNYGDIFHLETSKHI